MIDVKAPRLLGAILSAVVLLTGYSERTLAQTSDTATLQQQVQQMQQKLDELNRKLAGAAATASNRSAGTGRDAGGD